MGCQIPLSPRAPSPATQWRPRCAVYSLTVGLGVVAGLTHGLEWPRPEASLPIARVSQLVIEDNCPIATGTEWVMT